MTIGMRLTDNNGLEAGYPLKEPEDTERSEQAEHGEAGKIGEDHLYNTSRHDDEVKNIPCWVIGEMGPGD